MYIEPEYSMEIPTWFFLLMLFTPFELVFQAVVSRANQENALDYTDNEVFLVSTATAAATTLLLYAALRLRTALVK